MTGKIFLNYRRGDDPGYTQALYQRLEEEFAAGDLFMDVEGHIKPGDDFVEILASQVAAADVLLAVIGPRWAELLAARENDQDDFVSIEIRAALEQGKRVIPVLVGGASIPRADTLPEAIRPLARRNAVGLRPERFKADCQGLVAALKESLAAAETERAARTEAERQAAEASRIAKEAEEAERIKAAEEREQKQRLAGLSSEEIRKAEELANWDFVKERGKMDALRDHLARFPSGVTALYATTRLGELVWASFGPAATLPQLRAYLEEFPEGDNAAAARTRLETLEREEAELREASERARQETEAWATASGADTQASYETYLAAWPDGEHGAAARARLQDLTQKVDGPVAAVSQKEFAGSPWWSVVAGGLAIAAVVGVVLAVKHRIVPAPDGVAMESGDGGSGQGAQSILGGFTTASGTCDTIEMARLEWVRGGETYTIAPAVIYRASGPAPAKTALTLPALTPLRCHRREGDKLLVSSDSGSCGWVDDLNLLRTKADPAGEKGILSGSDLVCGAVKPMSMREFCAASEQLANGQVPRECKISWVKSSPFDAKLVLWNAGASANFKASDSNEVPTYRSPDADERLQNVKIFNVLRVFDIKPSKTGVRYLIGASHRRMQGWVDSTAGTIWYSKLAVYYARGGKRPVLRDEPGAGEPRSIGEKPPNIAAMLNGTSAFRPYPVLVDNRESKPTDPATKRPHLEIALIGGTGSGSEPTVARGFVETAAVGQRETNWDYFVEIRLQNLRDLQRSFESLCGNIKTYEDSKIDLESSISKVVEILTGDVIEDNALLETYFGQRETIPLSDLTILGPGIMQLGRDLSATTATARARVGRYQREVCRTSTLLSLMQSSQRLAKPADGGDLVWDDKKEIYSYKNAKPFDWQFKDDFGESSIFLPLTYMPRAPDAVVQSKAE